MAQNGYVRKAAFALIAGACALPAITAGAQRAAPALLDRIEPGQWELRDRDNDEMRTRLCVASGWQMVQIRHQREQCRSFVVQESPGAVTVHYTCPGNGYGRTEIRLENPRLAQVETQGIAGGLPFLFAAEARRIGDCPR
ncbi:MAG: hypothetical protein RIS94_2239 [Pseudomonadota bacterium]|jgi:hypothetical protein